MADFTDEHKEEMGGDFFGQGVHKVQIQTIEFGETEGDAPKEFVEFTVVDPENAERTGKARLWFHTDGAIKYSFNTIRTIFVHNAPEDKKDDVRAKFDALKNTEELDKACQKMLIGKEAWYSVYENPERTYPGADGSPKNSYDKNITGYEPKPRTVTVGEGPAQVTGEPVDSKDQPFGF